MHDAVYDKIKNTGRLPSPSGVALKLMRLADDPSTTIEQFSTVVETDPATAARVLRLVNSPLAGQSRSVTSISMAVRLMGMPAVRNVALGCSLLAANQEGASKVFDFEHFWAASLARAAAGRVLASHLGGCAADEAFAVALLSRVGQLAFATVFAPKYDEILDRMIGQPLPALLEAERDSFDIDQNQLTAMMMEDWRLADVFCQAVRQQDMVGESPSADRSRISNIAHMLQFVTRIAHVMTGSDVYREDLTELVDLAQSMNIDGAKFREHFETVNRTWKDIASHLSVTTPTAPTLAQVHTRAPRQHRNVLVVDDDPASLALVDRYLANEGYEVLTAGNGKEALQVIRDTGCRLVITDRNMPEMNGIELCEMIRQSEGFGFVYIIMLTVDKQLASLTQAFDAGADDYVTKPIAKDELLARLKAGVRTLALEADLDKQRLELHKTNAEMAVLNSKLQRLATTDELTGLYNRREALARLEEHWRSAVRAKGDFACVLVDIDHFKHCNDEFGHDAGDEALRQVAQTLAQTVRKNESVFRVGGEEFLVLCPGSTAQQAATGAERLRATIESTQVRCGPLNLTMTISAGVAEKCVQAGTTTDLLRHADLGLYAAKRGGRNRVCIHSAREESAECVTDTASNDETSLIGYTPQASHEGPGVVLVAEYDPAAQRMICALLERDGYTVHAVSDGLQAMEKASQIHPDVILLDVEMPGLNGLECTRKLKADSALRDIPVIIISGQKERRQVLAGLEAGAQEYVTKPIVRDEFLLRVRAMNQLRCGKTKLQQSNAVRGEQARVMCILLDLSQALAIADTIDAVVACTVASAAELLNCRRVAILLPNDTREFLHVADSLGIDDDLARKIQVRVGSDIAGAVFASGSTFLANTGRDEIILSDPYESEFFASTPLVSRALSVPHKVIGVLSAANRHNGQPFETLEIEYLDLICNMAASALEQLESAVAREQAYAAIVIGLAKLAEHRDADTGRHLERVTRYALLLAQELRTSPDYSEKIDDEFLFALEQAMPLHDIGKVSVPDAILLKAGPLTDEEYAAVNRHAEIGAAAIQTVIEQAPDASFLTMARDIALCHHEHVDGSGYPGKLMLNEIPLAARIAAVADVYDALTTKRTYKDAFPHDKASRIIQGLSGRQFDPDVVAAFVRIEDELIDVAASLMDNKCCADNTIVADEPALSAV